MFGCAKLMMGHRGTHKMALLLHSCAKSCILCIKSEPIDAAPTAVMHERPDIIGVHMAPNTAPEQYWRPHKSASGACHYARKHNADPRRDLSSGTPCTHLKIAWSHGRHSQPDINVEKASAVAWSKLCAEQAHRQKMLSRVACLSHLHHPWAARYNTGLLIKLTPKGIFFFFS